MSRNSRYFLDTDESCHWYLIPEMYRGAWDKWQENMGEDEDSYDTPLFAKPLGGHPNRMTFTDPKETK